MIIQNFYFSQNALKGIYGNMSPDKKFSDTKYGVSRYWIFCPKFTKTHLQASVVKKIFPGAPPPDPHRNGEGGRGRG
jgi:hypothetical protein